MKKTANNAKNAEKNLSACPSPLPIKVDYKPAFIVTVLAFTAVTIVFALQMVPRPPSPLPKVVIVKSCQVEIDGHLYYDYQDHPMTHSSYCDKCKPAHH